ncbi:MAG: aminopeptidase P family protein [Bacteroidia bacterium]|nr:aminopeptidase P family protein [Bacteroidia bacterium]
MATFSASTYSQRRKKMGQAVGSGLILLLGNEESGMNYAANTYHFRQDSNFLYFTGIDRPGLAAIFDLDACTETIYGQEVTMDDVVWMGPLPTLRADADQAGIQQVRPLADLDQALQKATQKGQKIHFLPPYRPENAIKLFRWLGIHPDECKANASETLIRAIISLREIKTDEEIVEIEKAVRITNRMHLTAMKSASPGVTEAEITGAIYREVMSADAQLSFPVILSVDGQILHNHHHHNTLKSGQLVLCDCGSEAAGSHYAGDMTRAFPVDATFTQRQKEVYQACLDSQLAAIAAMKPGVLYRDVHLTAARVITEGLKGIGLMKGNTDEAVAAGAHALFFPHGLGHAMGLDVHEMEDLGENFVGYTDTLKKASQFGLAFLRFGKALQPGHVLTVEPGIYFIPELIDQWRQEGTNAQFINFDLADTFKDFGGIRIEDDLLVTAGGTRLLGDGVPKEIRDIEALYA